MHYFLSTASFVFFSYVCTVLSLEQVRWHFWKKCIDISLQWPKPVWWWKDVISRVNQNVFSKQDVLSHRWWKKPDSLTKSIHHLNPTSYICVVFRICLSQLSLVENKCKCTINLIEQRTALASRPVLNWLRFPMRSYQQCCAFLYSCTHSFDFMFSVIWYNGGEWSFWKSIAMTF